MTDQQAALVAVVNNGDDSQRQKLLEAFYQQWQNEPLVVNLWLQIQALCPLPNNVQRVRELMTHEAFQLKNPNKVRALIGAYCNANPINFHALDGSGYELLVETVTTLDPRNPQLASRLVTPLTRWRRYRGRSEMMRGALEQIAAQPSLSRDVYEIVTKSLV